MDEYRAGETNAVVLAGNVYRPGGGAFRYRILHAPDFPGGVFADPSSYRVPGNEGGGLRGRLLSRQAS